MEMPATRSAIRCVAGCWRLAAMSATWRASICWRGSILVFGSAGIRHGAGMRRGTLGFFWRRTAAAPSDLSARLPLSPGRPGVDLLADCGPAGSRWLDDLDTAVDLYNGDLIEGWSRRDPAARLIFPYLSLASSRDPHSARGRAHSKTLRQKATMARLDSWLHAPSFSATVILLHKCRRLR